jgi:hypothetical protein
MTRPVPSRSTPLSRKARSAPGSSARAGVLLTALLPLVVSGCGGSQSRDPATEGNDNQIIGGFDAKDMRLDAIGSLVLISPQLPYYPRLPPQILCGAALLTPESVLTAKHCADVIPQAISYGYTLAFALGPDASKPRKTAEIVAYEVAPAGSSRGFVGVGRDVAVLHLENPLAGEATVDIGVLTEEDLGKPFAAIGYGTQDNTGRVGTRKLGRQTLRAREGRVFEILFGGFEPFFDWFKQRVLGPGRAPMPLDGPVAISVVGESDGGGPVPAPDAGASDALPPADDGGIYDYVREYAQRLFDSVVLERDYEVVTGGVPGDSQPCFGDSGSPLIRRSNGRNVAYGVVSGGVDSRDLVCDYGTVYASFGPETLAFLQKAQAWVDPCGDLTSQGTCDGTVARRCTNLVEGRRRLVEFDCAALELSCNSSRGQVACGDDAVAPPAPVMPVPGRMAPELAKSVNDTFINGAIRAR